MKLSLIKRKQKLDTMLKSNKRNKSEILGINYIVIAPTLALLLTVIVLLFCIYCLINICRIKYEF